MNIGARMSLFNALQEKKLASMKALKTAKQDAFWSSPGVRSLGDLPSGNGLH